MLRYHFQPDRGHHALAWKQAQSYPGSEDELRIKGNLAEIAFYEFLRHTVPIDLWHWHNEGALRHANQEYNDHDFTIAGKTVDVKGRSAVGDIFDLDSIESDLVVPVGIPSEMTEEMDVDCLTDFAIRGIADYEPVVMLGVIGRESIDPEPVELFHPAPDAPSFEELSVEPIEQFPAGLATSQWFQEGTQHDRGHDEYEGIRTFHTDVDGSRLPPGSAVERVSGDYFAEDEFPDRGLIVERLSRPAGASFNRSRKEYQPRLDKPVNHREPEIGVVSIEDLSPDVFEKIQDLAEEHVYPAISQVVAAEVGEDSIHYAAPSETRLNSAARRGVVRAEYDDLLADSWWS